jgi:Protein of unknwon function (DUF3310)
MSILWPRVGFGDGRETLGEPAAAVSILSRFIQLKTDPATNPAHYQGDYVMRIIEDFKLDFLSGTVLKYILRAGSKPQEPELRDLQKARWYLDRKISNLAAFVGERPETPEAQTDSRVAKEIMTS